MENKNAVIKFNDGSELNVAVNGTCYISEDEPVFPSDLTNITITGDEGETTIKNGRIVEVFPLGDGHWFGIEDIPESERATKQVRADVDYIAMELDIDL